MSWGGGELRKQCGGGLKRVLKRLRLFGRELGRQCRQNTCWFLGWGRSRRLHSCATRRKIVCYVVVEENMLCNRVFNGRRMKRIKEMKRIMNNINKGNVMDNILLSI